MHEDMNKKCNDRPKKLLLFIFAAHSTPPRYRGGAIFLLQFVCLCVCLSVCLSACEQNARGMHKDKHMCIDPQACDLHIYLQKKKGKLQAVFFFFIT